MKKIIVLLSVVLIVSLLGNVFQYKNIQAYKTSDAKFRQQFGFGITDMPDIQNDYKESQKTVVIALNPGVSETKAFALKSLLEKQPAVQSVQYVSQAQVMSQFTDKYMNDAITLQALHSLGTDPYGPNLNITLTDGSQRESFISYIKSTQYSADIAVIH